MKQWKDDSSFMIVWTHGFEYEANFESLKTPEELVSIIKKFYSSKRFEEESAVSLKFSGGHLWVSRYLPWIMPGPESWFYHTIQISLLSNNKIKILYQAKAYLTLIVHKISFQKEIGELRAHL